MPNFCRLCWHFLQRGVEKKKLRCSLDQWSKIYFSLDVQPEIQIFNWLHSRIGLEPVEPYFHKYIWPLITLCLIIWICFICFRRKTNWKYYFKDWRTPKAKRPGTGWQTWTAGKGTEGKRKRHHQSRIEFEKCQRFKKTRRKEKATNYQGMYFEAKSSLKDRKDFQSHSQGRSGVFDQIPVTKISRNCQIIFDILINVKKIGRFFQ